MLVESTNRVCFKSVYSTLYLQEYINATCVLKKQESQLLLGWGELPVSEC